MKKRLILITLLLVVVFLSGCSNKEEGLVLRVYNWQDYINTGIDDDGNKVSLSTIEKFQKWYYDKYKEHVEVQYDTFETNEIMLNNIKTGKSHYDIVCPSDYTIQKMISLNMVEKIDMNLVDRNGDKIMSDYHNISPYLSNLFKIRGWDEYAIPYMWGTVGLIYNMDIISKEEISTWDFLWDTDLKVTIKDSIRDTYVVGVMKVYKDELNKLSSLYKKKEISNIEYSKKVTEIMNRVDDDTLRKVEKELIALKKNIYGLEVDSGKNDIVTGKIDINLAWSGDAVYSMDSADEEGKVNLGWAIPKEGSNFWFDGWSILKNGNQVLSQQFINFLCKSEIAKDNMEYVGYTSSVASDETFDYIKDLYGSDTGEEVDLSYFFNGNVSDSKKTMGKVIIKTDTKGRQFSAQFPTEDEIARCGTMEDFKDRNDAVIEMWQNVKIGNISILVTILLLVFVVLVMGVLFGRKYYKQRMINKRKKRFN